MIATAEQNAPSASSVNEIMIGRALVASHAIKAVELTDTWALRELTICVRDVAQLSPFARQLVEHMQAA